MVVPNPRDVDAAASVVGILSFEAAATMSRLVSLHRSLSGPEVSRLRSDAMRSQGVAYLNSTDQSFLLRLACAELVDDLDSAAEAVSRLSRRCRAALPLGFDRLYTDLKSGSLDPTRLLSTAKSVEKKVKKMDKYVSTTEKLFHEMELLNAMEATERRKWSRLSGPIPMQKSSNNPDQSQLPDIKSQQQKVRRLKEDSLWSQPLDKAVEAMALAAYSIFARICVVFGPYVSGLPHVVVYKETSRMGFAAPHLKFRISPRSGPLERSNAMKEVAIRNSCPIPRTGCEYYNGRLDWSRVLQPPPNTVGGSGLALRYANVILQAEKVMTSEGEAASVSKDEREELYWQLPPGLRSAVCGKLREYWRRRGPSDGGLAEGWKEAVRRIMGWLGPVAHDTVRWQGERTMDRTQRFESRPRTLALQTLQFSDREKTEAAIAEVLVGLSLVCWYDERGRGSLRYC